MKILLLLSALPFTFAAASAHYKIAAKIFIDGKYVSSPTIVTNGDEEAEISQGTDDSVNRLTLTIKASDESNEVTTDGIRLKMTLHYQSASRTLVSAPDLVVQPGHEVTYHPSSNGNYPNPELKISVVATRE